MKVTYFAITLACLRVTGVVQTSACVTFAIDSCEETTATDDFWSVSLQ